MSSFWQGFFSCTLTCGSSSGMGAGFPHRRRLVKPRPNDIELMRRAEKVETRLWAWQSHTIHVGYIYLHLP